jgi:hypothetical protein
LPQAAADRREMVLVTTQCRELEELLHKAVKEQIERRGNV